MTGMVTYRNICDSLTCPDSFAISVNYHNWADGPFNMATAFARSEAQDPFGGGAAGESASTFRSQALRKKMALFLSAALCAATAIGVGYQLAQPEVVYTDDAYVAAPLAQVTPQIDGIISHIWVHETEYVHRGQILVTLDREDAELDYQTALAGYEEAIRRAQEEIAKTKAANADVQVKQLFVEQSRLQLRRRNGSPGIVSEEEISKAETAVTAAKYALLTAQNEAVASRAMVSELNTSAVPAVKIARVNVARAVLRMQRTVLRASVDGVVAQLHVQAGQQVAPGVSLMSIVPIHQLYVEANFKESQISRVSVGQRAILASDLYGSDKIFHGTVEGIGGGTGAAFSILPAQNASGNWIKVVQRVPVRILLDTQDLHEKPLRVGLSMNATVQVAKAVDQATPEHARPALRAVARTAF